VAITFALGVLTSAFVAIAPLRGEHFIDLLGPLPILAMTVVGGLVASKRPQNTIGWLLIGIGFFLVGQGFAQRYSRYVYEAHHPLSGAHFAAWFGTWTFMPAIGFLALVFMLFPTGRPLSRRWRPLVLLSSAVVLAIPFLALPSLQNSGRKLLTAPSTAELAHAKFLTVAGEGGLQALLAIGIVTLIVRFIRSRDLERQQMKWFVLGAVVLVGSVALVFAASSFLHTDDPVDTPIGEVSMLIGFCAISVATGFAVLRYRLYDVDRVISRTVSYALITGLLAGIYVVVALVPTAIFGAAHIPSWLVAAGTLIAAALFRPGLRRVRAVVDRRFDRTRYDTALTIEQFASRLRDDIDLDTLRAEIEAVVGRTMQPRHVSVWLRR